MTSKKIKRFFTTLLWMGSAAGFLLLVMAAIRVRNKQNCKGVQVEIVDPGDNFFVEKSDIKALILSDKKLNPVGKELEAINIRLLEQKVKNNPWVKEATLYIGNNNKLDIRITQKQPIGRVFTKSGNSYYLDEHGEKIPVMNKFTARVPVFTNFPTDALMPKGNDSLLFRQMTALSLFIVRDSFWHAFVEQININSDKEFEITPRVGRQVIEFGDGTNIPEKFSKLLLFYQKRLRTVGWEMYDTINIAYQNEVVCTRNEKYKPL